jgi:hypothetical protein
MYSEDLMPDSDTFASAMEACGAANEWEWILQLLARGFKMFQVFSIPSTRLGKIVEDEDYPHITKDFFVGVLATWNIWIAPPQVV